MSDDADAELAPAGFSSQLSTSALIYRTLRNLHESFKWAWLDVVCQYRRSRIGPWWETLNAVVMIAGLSVVSAAVFNGDAKSNVGYVGLGVVTWAVITSAISDGAMALVKSANFILNSNISIDLYVGRTAFKIFITFCHNIVLYFVGLALFLVPLSWTALLAIPGVIILFINAIWVVTALSIFCARYRDVEPIVRNLLQLAFFATPVFWNYHQLPPDRAFLIQYNVLFYLIEMVRRPLLGEIPPASYYYVAIGFTVFGYALAYMAYRSLRRQMAFFV